MAACAKWPSARSRSCACSGVAPFCGGEPGARAVQAQQRDVDVGGDDELHAAQPVAQLPQPGEVVGGHLTERPAAGAEDVRRSRQPESAGQPDQGTRAGVVRRGAAEPDDDPSRSRVEGGGEQLPHPAARGAGGVAQLVRDQREADGLRGLDVRGRAHEQDHGRDGRADRRRRRSPGRAHRRAPTAAWRRSRGRRPRAGTRSPRRAVPSCATLRRWSRRPRRPSGSSRSCRGR